ncbi:MAG: hypothetical protein DME19_10355 [Verrucomicrobia bacterium]|nr:MAG: hypothetical protein DME19_10355 [Verrucomicrobiota bacterium]
MLHFRQPVRIRHKKICRLALVKVLLLAVCWTHPPARTLNAGAFDTTQYRYDAWKIEQGLPQNTAKVIFQTRDGYLWFATRFGIVRFDGVSFRVFDRGNTPEIGDENGISMVEEADGTFWIATWQGATRYKDRAFTHFELGRRKTDDRLWAICSNRQGGIWAATSDGLLAFEPGRPLARYATNDGLSTNLVTSVLEDTDGMLWVGTELGLQRRDPGSARFIDAWAKVASPADRVHCLHRDLNGNLWVGASSGLHRLRDGQWTSYTTRNGLPDNRVDFITHDSLGNLWIATGDGVLLRFRDGVFTRFGKKEGLSDNWVLCALEDREGNLWVGTNYGGLNRMQPRRILAYSALDGLIHNNVWSIRESERGGIWIGTENGVSHFKNGEFTNFSLGKNPDDNHVKSVFQDRAGNLWIGTRAAGLKRMQNGRITGSFTTQDGLPNNQVNAIYQDKQGRIWIGTQGGLCWFKDGTITNAGLPKHDIRAIHQDSTGDLWIGEYGGGVNRLHDRRFISFTTREGLSDDRVFVIYEDEDHALWIGTENGLNRLEDGTITRFTVDQGLFDNVINDILEDSEGNMWISCNRGIYRVRKEELLALVRQGKDKRVKYISYGTSDGMLSSETNGENQPAACKTRDGKLWVRIHEQLLGSPGPVRLPPGRGDLLEVRYTANSLVAPEKVRFKYRLEGWDQNWVEAGNRRVAHYTNLRPGNYTFRVIACNNHEVWNHQGASFAFFLAPHFYQMWPFYVMCGLFVILFGYALHWGRLRVVRKIERLEKQHALEKERARIANEMHDDLGSSLTQIALLSELVNRDLSSADKVGEHIQKITTTTREVFRAMDEIVWAVNLVDYLSKYAQDFLRPAGIRCRLDLPARLTPYPLTTEARHNLFLTAKEALNNIVKHATASEVWFRVALDTTRCSICIEDNGCGFRVGSTRPGGNGLTSMKERLAAIGGEFKLDSRHGNGTRLELIVQLKQVQ